MTISAASNSVTWPQNPIKMKQKPIQINDDLIVRTVFAQMVSLPVQVCVVALLHKAEVKLIWSNHYANGIY